MAQERGRPPRVFSVVFRCQPFRYVYPAPSAVTFTSAGQIANSGNIYAEPIITVTGDGDIALSIGDSVLQLTDVIGSITIDVPTRIAYKGSTNQSYKLEGDWPTIPIGTSTVSWEGGATNVSSSAILLMITPSFTIVVFIQLCQIDRQLSRDNADCHKQSRDLTIVGLYRFALYHNPSHLRPGLLPCHLSADR